MYHAILSTNDVPLLSNRHSAVSPHYCPLLPSHTPRRVSYHLVGSVSVAADETALQVNELDVCDVSREKSVVLHGAAHDWHGGVERVAAVRDGRVPFGRVHPEVRVVRGAAAFELYCGKERYSCDVCY